MARANQAKWFADALVSYSQGYRSFEAMAFTTGAAMQAGQVLAANGALAAANGLDAARILLEAVPARTAGQTIAALVLARDAEVNDAYLVYGAANASAANGNLSLASNIIVRFGVLANSIVSPSMLDEEGRPITTEGEPPPPEGSPPPEPVAV